MSSENKDGGNNTTPAKHTTSQAISDKLDLDKNPVEYATGEPGKTTLEPHDKSYLELTLRAGQHSELVQKLLRQRIELRAKEFPRWPAEATGGVRSLWIESRFWYDRERLGPDFDEDWREYRAKYLHSLELDPREPVHVPEYETWLINPIRRFYMKGGDWFENQIVKRIMGKRGDKYKTALYRVFCTRTLMSYFACIGLFYWVKYNSKKWEMTCGPGVFASKPIMYPSDKRFPFKDYKTEPGHHYDTGFSQRTIFKDLRDYEDRTVLL